MTVEKPITAPICHEGSQARNIFSLFVNPKHMHPSNPTPTLFFFFFCFYLDNNYKQVKNTFGNWFIELPLTIRDVTINHESTNTNL